MKNSEKDRVVKFKLSQVCCLLNELLYLGAPRPTSTDHFLGCTALRLTLGVE